MGVVTAEIVVSKDPAHVFAVAREVEKYPEFMPDVSSVEILERRDDGYTKAAWAASVKSLQ